jgi:hypothetical protein
MPSGWKTKNKGKLTSSSAWEWVFSAMNPKQVQAVSVEIVRDIDVCRTIR